MEETILEPLPKKTLTLHNFCIWYPNVAFFGGLVPRPFPFQEENMKI